MGSALNFLWFIGNGIVLGPLWYLFGLFMAVSIVGLPWARAAYMLGNFALFPFGREVISRKDLTLEKDIGTGALGTIGNIIWFVLFGWILALLHIVLAIFCAVSIIAIPFSIQHLKLAGAALFPVGKTVQAKELVALAKSKNTEQKLEALRGRAQS